MSPLNKLGILIIITVFFIRCTTGGVKSDDTVKGYDVPYPQIAKNEEYEEND
jgi:hypothetical protein